MKDRACPWHATATGGEVPNAETSGNGELMEDDLVAKGCQKAKGNERKPSEFIM